MNNEHPYHYKRMYFSETNLATLDEDVRIKYSKIASKKPRNLFAKLYEKHDILSKFERYVEKITITAPEWIYFSE